MSERPPSRLRRLVRWTVRIGLALVVLVLAVWVLRGALFEARIARALTDALTEELGGTWRIDRIDGNWLTGAEIVGLRADPMPPTGALRELSFERARVTYGIRDLLRDPLTAIRSAEIEGLRVVIDTASPSAPDDATPDPTFADVLDAIPRPLPRLDARGTLLVHTPDGDWESRSLHIDGGGTSLVLELGDVLTPLPADAGDGERLRAAIEWPERHVVTWVSQDALAGVSVTTARAIAGPGAAWRIETTGEVARGEVSLTASETGVEGIARQVDAAQLPAWIRAGLGKQSGAVPDRGTVDVVLQSGTAVGPAAVNGRITGAGLEWADLRVAHLDAHGSWRDGHLRIDALDADGEGVRAHGRGVVVVPDAEFPIDGVEGLDLEVVEFAALLRRIGQEEFADRLPAGPTGLTVHAHSNQRVLQVEEATLVSPASRVTVRGKFDIPADLTTWRSAPIDGRIEASLALADLRRVTPKDVLPVDAAGDVKVTGSLHGRLDTPTAVIDLTGRDLTLGGRAVREIAVSASVAWPAVHVRELKIDAAFARGSASGEIDVESGAVSAATFELDAPDLAGVSAAFPALLPLGGAVKAEGVIERATVRGEKQRAQGHVKLQGERVEVDRVALGTVAVDATFDGTRAVVRQLVADGALGRVDAAGGVDLSDGSFEAERVRLDVTDVAALRVHVPALPDVRGAVSFEGSARRAPGAPWSRVEGTGVVRAEELEVGNLVGIGLDASIRGHDGTVTIESLRAHSARWDLDAAGNASFEDDATAFALDRFELRIDEDHAKLSAPARVVLRRGEASVDAFELGAFGGTLRGSARIGDSVTAQIDAREIDLAPFVTGVEGRAALRISVTGPSSAPDVHVTIEAPSLRWEGREAHARAALRQDASGIHAEDLDIDLGDALTARGSFDVPWRLGSSGWTAVEGAPAKIGLSLKSSRPEGWLRLVTSEPVVIDTIDAEVAGDGAEITARVHVHEFRWTRGDLEPVRLAGDTVVDVRSGAAGTSARVRGGEGGILVLVGDASSPLALDWTRPGGVRETLSKATVDAKVSGEIPDLGALRTWIPGLRHLAGRARAEVTLHGEVLAPSWAGSVQVNDLAFVTEGDFPPVDRADAVVRLDGRKLHIDSATARLGYSPVTFAGDLEFPEDGPPVLALHVKGENLLLVRSQDLRLRGDTDLHADGPLDALVVKGTLGVTRGLYTRPMDLLHRGAPSADEAFQLFSVRDGPLASARFDVEVTADDTFRVENDLLNGAVSARLHVRGTGEVPELEGVVEVRDARVTLPFSHMEVERGRLDFRPGSPFRPEIRAVATAQIKGYELVVALSGALPDVEVHVASSPPLSQASARLLLATGATPIELEQQGIAGTALSRAGSLLGDAVLTWVSGPGNRRDDSLLDRVTVEFGHQESRDGTETAEARLKLSERWYLVAERDLYAQYNVGIVWRVKFR